VPVGVSRFIKNLGFSEVIELNHGESVNKGAFSISAVWVNHAGGRFFPWQNTSCSSYVVQSSGKSILMAGDVDFGPLDYFSDIKNNFSIDLALLPVGGMRCVSYYVKRRGKSGVHIDPQTAWEAFKLSGASRLIPIHWGTLSVARTSTDEAPTELLRIAGVENSAEKVIVLSPGQSFTLD
jgi:L-ascorbate metabolism protein UlaG (beta-lactamase superfamily)